MLLIASRDSKLTNIWMVEYWLNDNDNDDPNKLQAFYLTLFYNLLVYLFIIFMFVCIHILTYSAFINVI